MTTTATLLPAVPQPTRTQPSDDSVRARPSKDNSDEARKADTKDTDCSSDVRTRNGEPRGSFEDTLKKSIVEKQNKNPDAETPNEGASETAAPLAAETQAVSAFVARPFTLGIEKTAKITPEQSPRTAQRHVLSPYFRMQRPSAAQPNPASQKNTESQAAKEKPIPLIARPNGQPQANDKSVTRENITSSATEKESTSLKAKPENTESSPQRLAAQAPIRSEQTAPNAAPNVDKKSAASVHAAVSIAQYAKADAPNVDKNPLPMQSAAIQSRTSQKVASDGGPESSLKANDADPPKPNLEKKLLAESPDAGSKTLSAIDVKEQGVSATEASKALGRTEFASSVVSAETSVPSSDAAKGLSPVAPVRPIDQIVQTLQLRTFGAESQVRMMLAPDDLGAIRITFRQINSQIVGLLEVQKTDTRKEIERSVAQLTAAMETAGLQVRRIEVVPWNNSAQNNPQQPQHGRSDLFGQDVDPRSHEEMYRSTGDGASSRHSNNGTTDPIDTAAPLTGSSSPAETGLNFFL